MLPDARRLRRRHELLAVQRRGARHSAPRLVIHVLPGPEPRPARAGFVVSRSVGGAVVRNTVKRRLRHLMASRLDALAPGTDVVLRARPAAAGASSALLARDLDGLLVRGAR